MKNHIKNRFLLLALIAGIALPPAHPAAAQTFTTLHSFTALSGITNSDGAFPDAGLILSGNTLYGTANNGGISGQGAVFAIIPGEMSFTNLYDFTMTAYADGETEIVNSDGAGPNGGLILSGGTLYGTASGGGTNGSIGIPSE
jgi:hypothetical protein